MTVSSCPCFISPRQILFVKDSFLDISVSKLVTEKNYKFLNALVIVMTLGGGGDPRPTRIICQRACDAPEAICHSAFSRRWEICHYSVRADFGPLPSEAPSLV